MGRSNKAARNRNAKGRLNRREKGAPRMGVPMMKVIPRVEIDDLVIPDGMCYRNPRKPKAKFIAEASAAKALAQAQAQRRRMGSSHMEKRYYPCEVAEGGCGAFHLTSREEYDPAWKRGTA